MCRRGRVGTKEPVESFLAAMESDDWWLGDVALQLEENGRRIFLYPDADGAFLNVVTLGRGAEIRHAEIMNTFLEVTRFIVEPQDADG